MNTIDKIKSRIAFSLLPEALRSKYLSGITLKHPRAGELKLGFADEVLSLNISAIWNAITVLSGHIASLPVGLYKRTSAGKELVKDHPLYDRLKYSPNPDMTSYLFRQAIVANLELSGIAYIYKIYGFGTAPLLYPLIPWTVRKDTTGGTIKYYAKLGKTDLEIEPFEMIVIMGLTFDGLNPVNPIAARHRSVRLMQRAEEQAERYYENGANMSGLITLPDKNPSDVWLKQFRENWRQTQEGMLNEHKTGLLYGGADYKNLGFTAEEIQMLQTRKFTPSEVARWFNIPVSKLKDYERATYNNIEHMQIEYVQDSLLPRVTNLEESLEMGLLGDERKDYFIEFNLEGLKRGDTKSRNESLEIQRRNGIISGNDWRRLENYNPDPNPAAELKFIPLNMIPINIIQEFYSAKNEERSGSAPGKQRSVLNLSGFKARRLATEIYRPLYGTISARLVKKEVQTIRGLIQQHLLGDTVDVIGFRQAAETFFGSFPGDVKTGFTAVIDSYRQELIPLALSEVVSEKKEIDLSNFQNEYLTAMGKRWATSSLRQIISITRTEAEAGNNPAGALEERLSEWEKNKAAKITLNESIRAEGAFSKAAWQAAGVTSLRWVAEKGDCPLCSQLNEKTIGIDSAFLGAGESLYIDGKIALTASGTITHPGLHDGCECGIAPA